MPENALPAEAAPPVPATNRRKPWLAALLSLPCPGLGNLYAGDLWGMLFTLLLVYFAFVGPPSIALNHPSPSTIWLVWLGPILIVTVGPVYAWISAKRAPLPYDLKPYNRWYVYVGVWLLWVTVFELAVTTVRAGVIEAFRIPSGSMEPTVRVGDFIYVDKRPTARTSVTRGTIVTFESVEEPGMIVMKRVVGVPGDTLAMVQGRFMRNGQAVNEPYVISGEPRTEDAMQRAKMRLWQRNFYVGGDAPGYQPDIADWGPLVVAAESYFTMGDNRDHAYDSRYWGLVPAEAITGQPRVVYYSYDPESYKPVPILSAVRWYRIGKDLSR